MQTKEVVDAMTADVGLGDAACLRVDGGASTNDMLMQLQADLLQVTHLRVAVSRSGSGRSSEEDQLHHDALKVDMPHSHLDGRFMPSTIRLCIQHVCDHPGRSLKGVEATSDSAESNAHPTRLPAAPCKRND